MGNNVIKNLTASAMFIAIGFVLPFLTGQISLFGNMMLPMHMPVFLCGLICGWKYGAAVGFVLPLFRYFVFGMPPIFPIGIAMALELTCYGLVAGFLYGRSHWQCVIVLYRSIIVAMLVGRVVWGTLMLLLLGISNEVFTWQMFISGAFLNAIPGIVTQLILIPAIMIALNHTGLVRFHRVQSAKAEAMVDG